MPPNYIIFHFHIVIEHHYKGFSCCISMKAGMPTLSAVVLKVSVIPASSATSERHFSALKLSVPSNSSCLKDDIIDAKAVLYSSASD